MEGGGIVADGGGREPQDGYLGERLGRREEERGTDRDDGVCHAHGAEEGGEVVLAQVVPGGEHAVRVFDEDEGDDGLDGGGRREHGGSHGVVSLQGPSLTCPSRGYRSLRRQKIKQAPVFPRSATAPIPT